MTLPSTSLERLDPVAVGASNDALMPLDFSLDRSDGLQGCDVGCLALHVIEVQRHMMFPVAAVDASMCDFVLGDPLLDGTRPVSGEFVQVLPDTRLRQIFVSILLGLGGGSDSRRSGSIPAKIRAVLGRGLLGLVRFTALLTGSTCLRDAAPRFLHGDILATDDGAATDVSPPGSALVQGLRARRVMP